MRLPLFNGSIEPLIPTRALARSDAAKTPDVPPRPNPELNSRTQITAGRPTHQTGMLMMSL